MIELIVSLGLFATVVLLSSGAYLIMVHLNQKAQATATGIDNLSFALETMTRTIRTGHNYSCVASGPPQDCPSSGSGSPTFSFTDVDGNNLTYKVATGPQSGTNDIAKLLSGKSYALTDYTSVYISSLTFYLTGSTKGDGGQPTVMIVVTGTVSAGAGKTQNFSVETMATMRGTDI